MFYTINTCKLYSATVKFGIGVKVDLFGAQLFIFWLYDEGHVKVPISNCLG